MDIKKIVWKKCGALGAEYYSAEGIVYCASPTTPERQCLNIYVPSEYLNSDGSINSHGVCGGYTAATAPILYINSIGLYLGKVPYKITESEDTLAGRQGWYFDYIKRGFVLAFVGARGKDDVDGDGVAVGKAPIALADLKAGIRFLRHNKDNIPGDTDKIISSGMSAGGAMSILIAVSGNSSEFDEYLNAMGAVTDERDDVYAAQVYCPIIDLDHADAAYEFMYLRDNNTIANSMSDFNKTLSEDLYNEYINYFNGRKINADGVEYRLGEDGRSGTFYDYVLEKFIESYRAENGEKATVPEYLSSLDSIVAEHNHRSKGCPCFDALFTHDGEGESVECGVFGSRSASKTDGDFRRHFSPSVTMRIKVLEKRYPDEYEKYYELYRAQSELEEVKKQVALYNPYNYIYNGGTDIAGRIRICVGSADSATSIVVSAQLALTLKSLGIDTEYYLMWGQGHTDADRPGEFISWVDRISK